MIKMNLKEKLESLKYCITPQSTVEDAAFEDAAGHLCDLLEYCRLRIKTDDDKKLVFKTLQTMIRFYGKNLNEVTEK